MPYAGIGTKDPRLNQQGDLDFILISLYQAWRKADDPLSRVKPLSLAVVGQIWMLAHTEDSAVAMAAATCLIIGFFFLLRPGKYSGTTPRQDTGGPIFCLCDVQ